MKPFAYSKTPKPQLLFNGGFEKEILSSFETGNWVSEVPRSSEGALFQDYGHTLEKPLMQTSTDLLVLGETISVSFLASGTPSVSVIYQVMDDNFGLVEIDQRIVPTALNSTGFYFTTFKFKEDSRAKYAQLRLESPVPCKIDNIKLEASKSPTAFSHSDKPEEALLANVSDFDLQGPNSEDSLEVSDSLINLTRASTSPPQAGDLRDGSSASSPVIGNDPSSGYSSSRDFTEKTLVSLKEKREEYTNRKETRFTQKADNEEDLQFDRRSLKEAVDDFTNTGSMQRSVLSSAKHDIASKQRAFEMRNHSRIQYYCNAFMDRYLDSLYYKHKDGAVGQMSGSDVA